MEGSMKKWNQDLFVERLGALMIEAGDSTYKLAKVIGCDASTITRWMIKDTVPRVGKLDRLAVYYGVNPFWLMGWPGHDRNDMPPASDSDETISANAPFDFVHEVGSTGMEPTIKIGSKVGIKEGVLIRNGEIALVEANGTERSLKRIYQTKTTLFVYGDNGGCQPQAYELSERDNIRIIGKAVTVSYIPK